MLPKILLSPIEHKILLGFVFSICCIFYINLSNRVIESYNEDVRFEQNQNQNEANNPKTKNLKFAIYDNPRALMIYEFIFWLQFLTLPLSFFLLRKQKLKRFIFSTVLTSFTFLSFLNWAFSTFNLNAWAEIPISKNLNFNNYVFHDSNFLEFFLFILVSILLTLQLSILFRFVCEKFQVKIS